MLDFIRGLISIFLAIIIYWFLSLMIIGLTEYLSLNIWTLSLRFIFADGLTAFLSFFIALLIMSRRYKIVIGAILLYFLFGMYIYELILRSGDFWAFLFGIIEMSMNALGAIIAILICINIGGNKQISKQVASKKQQTDIKKQEPKLPWFLMFLALISVPTTYIVMILSAFITLGICAWLFLIVFSLPRIPIIIILALGIAPLIGIYVAFRALRAMFVAEPAFYPAIKLNLTNSAVLKKTIIDVCGKVKTAEPDIVILHAEPTFFVLQGKIKIYDGEFKGRILAIGAPLIRNLTALEFQAILAHEFAHFSGSDTLYSAYVVPVYRAIQSSLTDLEGVEEESSSDLMNMVNILLLVPRLFLDLFDNYFSTIDSALSRSRELRADWISANIFGSSNFASGLTKVIQISSHFADKYDEIISKKKENLYDNYNNMLQQSSKALESYKNKALAETEQDFDSHPSLSTRINNLPIYETDQKEEVTITDVQKEISNAEQTLATNFIEDMAARKELYNKYLEFLSRQNK